MRGDQGRPMTPGPGTYNSRLYTGKEGPRITMSARPQTSGSREAVPGPGQYNMNTTNRPKSPSYKIGSAQRSGNFKYLESIPGPGQYSPGSNRPKSPTWVMGTGQRSAMNATELVPGPGNYNIGHNLGQGPKVNIIFLILVFNGWKKLFYRFKNGCTRPWSIQ